VSNTLNDIVEDTGLDQALDSITVDQNKSIKEEEEVFELPT
jgi:hypothetical protein